MVIVPARRITNEGTEHEASSQHDNDPAGQARRVPLLGAADVGSGS
jgi:hypothetical protein